MSSKSRKKTDPPRKNSGARRPTTDDPGVAVAKGKDEHGLFDIPDEIIHAPKETSKLRFVMMILLVVVLLVVFAIPDSIQSFFGRQTVAVEQAFTWERPGHGTEMLGAFDLTMEHRALADAFQVDPLLQYGLGITTQRLTRDDAARIYVLRKLAEDAGVRVTTAALGEHLQQIIDLVYRRDRELYKSMLTRYRGDIEGTIRSCLGVQRYMQLIAYAGAIPHPLDVVEAWNEEHLEVAFDYIEMPVTEFEEAARTELPEDEELQAWLDEKQDFEKNSLKTPEKRTADVVVYRDAETTPAAALLEAYPAEEGYDAEAKANEYYSRVYSRRFIKDVEPPAEGEVLTSPIPAFFVFDEVKETCLAEAPIYFAMVRWVEDLRARVEAGEEVDLAAEAAANGLDVVTVESMTRSELSEHEDLGDSGMVNTLFATQVGSYSYNVAATEKVLGFVRVTESLEPALPPFAEIREEVVEMWVEPRAKELAEEHLKSLWNDFEMYEPEDQEESPFAAATIHRRASDEEFKAAAEAAGHTVVRRDFVDRAGLSKSKSEEAIDKLLARNSQLSRLEKGEVAEPVTSPDGERVFIVRVADTREVPLDRMSPRDYERYQSTVRNRAQGELMRAMDLDFLAEHYGMVMNREFEDAVDDEDEENSDEPTG